MLYRVLRWTVGFVLLALVSAGAAPSAIAHGTARAPLPEAPAAPDIAQHASPSCASWSTAHIDCFVVGEDSNIWKISWDAETWSDWSNLGYPADGSDLVGGISVISRGANTLDLFVIGKSGIFTNLYQRTFSGGAWGAWVNLSRPDSVNVYEIACATTASTNLECFMRGSDNHLWQRSWNGGWDGWVDLGAFPSEWLYGGLAATTYGGGNLLLYAIGGNGHAYRRFYEGTWSGWNDDGYPPTSRLIQVACQSANSDQIDCVFSNNDGIVMYRHWDSATQWGEFDNPLFPPAPGRGVAITNYSTQGLVMLTAAEDGHFYRRYRFDAASEWSRWFDMGRPRDLRVFLPMIQR